MLITALIIVGIILVLAAVFSISDNLIQIEAKKQGVDTENTNLGIAPSLREIFGKPIPEYVNKNAFHHLKKGHDIKMTGKATGHPTHASVKRFAVKPGDFRGIAPIPKMLVQEGDEVKAGDALFFDKSSPDIKYAAPVSGEVVEIRRGAKRSISHVVILADKDQKYRSYDLPNLETADREALVTFLQDSGFWPLINQRPYDVIADPATTPQNIFISTFDSAPNGTDLNLVVEGREAHFQKGIDVLNHLTEGSVFLGLDGRKGHKPHDAYINASGARKHWFEGKHPSGNVGVQIHHTAPIRSNNVVWTLTVENVIALGGLFNDGVLRQEKVVAVCGGQINEPCNVTTYAGASINDLTDNNIVAENKTRIIAGDILTGAECGEDEFLSVNDNQVTAIKEGDDYELFGWLLAIAPRPSISKTFPAFLMPNYEYDVHTNTHGEERAFVVTGQYENVLPMDIYPQHLMKAIMAGDIERMEALGINELSEEDIALAEFACTSKQPLQSILREGLDMMREQA